MIAVGVDTHKDAHVAVALDDLGQFLGELVIEARIGGYAQLAAWARSLAAGSESELVFGIEGTGSWGAGLVEHLREAGNVIYEVERPRRRERRSRKTDRIDALMAAKRVLSGEGLATPRAHGTRRALTAILAVQRSCVGERTRLLNQLQALCVSAPAGLRERVGPGRGVALQARVLRMRTRTAADIEERVAFAVLRDLATRARALEQTASRYERELADLVRQLAPKLLDEPGIGPISAAKLLAADPARFKHERAFARCNGTAPLPASSGKTVRHRLSRGGDRQINNAIHTIALSRSQHQRHPCGGSCRRARGTVARGQPWPPGKAFVAVLGLCPAWWS
jgi:transposase